MARFHPRPVKNPARLLPLSGTTSCLLRDVNFAGHDVRSSDASLPGLFNISSAGTEEGQSTSPSPSSSGSTRRRATRRRFPPKIPALPFFPHPVSAYAHFRAPNLKRNLRSEAKSTARSARLGLRGPSDQVVLDKRTTGPARQRRNTIFYCACRPAGCHRSGEKEQEGLKMRREGDLLAPPGRR